MDQLKVLQENVKMKIYKRWNPIPITFNWMTYSDVKDVKHHNFRHGTSGDLGDLGSQKTLKISEDLNKMTNNFGRKAFQRSK